MLLCVGEGVCICESVCVCVCARACTRMCGVGSILCKELLKALTREKVGKGPDEKTWEDQTDNLCVCAHISI